MRNPEHLLCCRCLLLALRFHQEVTKLFLHTFRKFSLAAAAFALLLCRPAASEQPDVYSGATDAQSAQILDRYVHATETPDRGNPEGSVWIDIQASLPKLQKAGHLTALKKISNVGHSTYRVLSFQGDSAVKKEVIARYLQVDQSGQKDQQLAVIPANYKFKFKGKRSRNLAEEVYVFQVSPRKKRVGLFKGELWVDASSYLPVYEKGRLVKNPTVFFKRVDFERDYIIRDGVAVPEHILSTIDARIVGRVELNVEYSNFSPARVEGQGPDADAVMAEASQ